MKIKFFFIVFLISLQALRAQEVIVEVSPDVWANDSVKIDPARYHKLILGGIQIGSLYSDDRGFNSWLKRYGRAPGQNNFVQIGGDIQYIVKKTVLAGHVLSALNDGSKAQLRHTGWQLGIGRVLNRQNNKIVSVLLHIGADHAKARFGFNPPAPLLGYNVPEDLAVLRQNRAIWGPSVNFTRVFTRKSQIDKGFYLSAVAGANFALGKGEWQYGYYDDETSKFYGEPVPNMPKASQQMIHVSIKAGLWAAN